MHGSGHEIEKDVVGEELLFLLKQQRNLYHQLRSLSRQQKDVFWRSASPEYLVRIMSGRRKLIERLRLVNSKIKSIKANWSGISNKMQDSEKQQAKDLAGDVALIVKDLRDIDSVNELSKDVLGDTAQLAIQLAEGLE